MMTRLLIPSMAMVILLVFSSEINICYSYSSPTKNVPRRAFLDSILVSSMTCAIPPCHAELPNKSFIGSPPMILKYPSLQYLVPIYTFNLSIAYLANQLESSTQQGIQVGSKIVNNFFSGGLLSNKNIFRGMCAVYINEIQYDDPDRDHIYIDRVSRLQYCDSTLNALEKMQKPLEQLVANGASAPSEEVMGYLQSARIGLNNFLSNVPKKDIEQVKNWIVTMKTADLDHNGKIDDDELAKVSEEDRLLFKSVGQLLS